MKKKFIFNLLSFFMLSTNLHARLNVVFLNPEIENIFSLSKKYKSYYIVKKSNWEDHEFKKKILIDAPVCFINDNHDYRNMKRCMRDFNEMINPDHFDFLIDNGTESGVSWGGKLRSEFSVQNGLSQEQANLFIDKNLMKQHLQKSDPSILTAKFVHFPPNSNFKTFKKIILANLSFPVMIKLTDGNGSVGVYYVEDEQALDELIPQLDEVPNFYIAEEYIEGMTLRLDGYISSGKVQILYPAYYEPSCYDYYKFGQPQITYTDFDSKNLVEYTEFTQKILDALGYRHGIFHLEAIRKKDTGELYFLEIAARPGSDSHFLMEQMGYDYFKLNVDLQLGISARPTRFEQPSQDLNCAVVDCPTLPYNDGKWEYQVLAQDPEYRFSKGSEIFFEDIKAKGEEFDLPGVPVPFASVGFKGKHALRHAREFRKSVKASFNVRNGRKSELVKWPLEKDQNESKTTSASSKKTKRDSDGNSQSNRQKRARNK